jgi:hypothetical protein
MAEFTGGLICASMWNYFDEWGLALALPRLEDETIPDYRSRLLDVIKHRASSGHLGLFYGINRDLGLNVWHDAITIKTAKNDDGLPILPDLQVEVRASGLVFSTNAFRVIREAEIVPSDTLRVKLTYKAVSRDILLEYPLGTIVSPEDWTFDWDRNEIVFNNQDYAGLTVTISYLYYEFVPTYGKTLDQVINNINALRTPGGDYVATATCNIDSSLSADGIPLMPAEFIEDVHITNTGDYYDEYRLPVGEASLRALNDNDFIKTIMGSGDVYFNTPLIRWIEQVNNLAGIGWEHLQFDQSRMGDDYGLSVIPTLADPTTTYYATSSPIQTETFSATEASILGFTDTGANVLHRMGFADVELQSGVGGIDDLKLIVEDGDKTVEFTPTVYDFFATPTGELTYTGETLETIEEGF